jgi:predicted small lipoprotein YifL
MTTHRTLRLLATVAAVSVLAACGAKEDRNPPAITFAPFGEAHNAKPDFAELEAQHPLSVEELYKITPKNLALLEQEQVDQIYARLSAGPIPDGAYEGDLFFPKGGSGKLRLSEIAGGGLKGLLINVAGKKLDLMGEILWKGKVFYRDERLLRNRIEDLKTLKAVGLIEESDANPLTEITVNGKDQWLLFPAQLYCGQSLLDGRRESIIIDYAFTDQLPGYRRMPDMMAGRDGFAIRDEVRMIRPGLYLGRAYIDRAFVVNFVLYNKAVDEAGKADYLATGKTAEDCWTGTQHRQLVAAAQ